MPGVPLPPTAQTKVSDISANIHAEGDLANLPGMPPGLVSLLSGEALSHLDELRTRVLWVVGVLAVTMPAAFLAAPPAVNWLKALAPPHVGFIQLAPGEVVMMQIKLAVIGGVVMSAPVILFHLLRFISPGLKAHERRWLAWVLLGGAGLFALGLWFSALWLLPPALEFLIGLGQEVAVTQLSIQGYVDFCLMMLLFCGLTFELPLVLWALALVGLVSSRQLMAKWREALVIIMVAAAVITPSQDPVSLILLGVVLVVLYALSIIPIRLMGR
jgi:sec-independent protein translocase protein TatC